MSDATEDLRATADDLAADAERLRRIEERKAALDPNDPALLTLSAEAEHLSKTIASKATVQHDLAKEVADDEGDPQG